MTSALVVAVLLSGVPSPEVDGHALFAKAQQVMLGGARRPWLLLASGSVGRSDKSGEKPSERFVVEWEPCGRRDVRGYFSQAARRVLGAAVEILCAGDPVASARVERNGSHVRYVWISDREWLVWTGDATSFTHADIRFGKDHIMLDIDPEGGIITRTRLEQRWTRAQNGAPRKEQEYSTVVGTAEFSDYRPVGTMRLPHRLQLQAEDVREDWTIERIEIVPLP